MYTHYAVARMSKDGLGREMYTRSGAYETPELAKRYGFSEMRDICSALPTGLALVRVETTDAGDGGRRLLRETVIEVLREPSDMPEAS